MKQLMRIAIVILLFVGCESRVEIPIKHAGVIITDREQVENQVLKPGEHPVGFRSKVIVYDVGFEKLEIEFDFLFKDASRGDLKLTIEFTPVVDSLPSFYRRYQSIYITPVVDSKSRLIIRNLLEDYNPTDFTKDELRTKIIDTLTNSREITNYVKVYKVDITHLR